VSDELEIRVARTHGDRLRAEYLITDVYNRCYDIVFSRDMVDLDSKIEPYPDAYLIATVGDDVVGAVGLYIRNTYVERYGAVGAPDLQRVVDDAGEASNYAIADTAEVTKLTVHPDWTGKGISHRLMEASHSRAFLMADLDRPPVLLCCATQRIFESMHVQLGITTRMLGPFPDYPVHERYRSPENPMSSRVMLPTLDIPSEWWDNELPQRYPLDGRNA
jgi:GNAT superfamily N-acetyltransferase